MKIFNASTVKKLFFLLLLSTFFTSVNFEDKAYYLTNGLFSFLLLISILTFLNNDIKVLFFLVLSSLFFCAILTTNINLSRYSDTVAIFYYYLFLVMAIKCIADYISGYKSARHT